mmetsp:Transcript_10798/g.19878  ORF Transcript_10798/g.19878 Transcript_10798/m.19878 type:complete len:242 (+) Transcript_10798:1-726(+)
MSTLPPVMSPPVIDCIHQINYTATINRAGGPVLFSCRSSLSEYDDSEQSQQRLLQGGNDDKEPRCRDQRRPLPLSVWPLVLERASLLEYTTCYEIYEERQAASLRRRADQVVARGEAVLRRVDRVVARARVVLGDGNNLEDQANDDNANNAEEEDNNNDGPEFLAPLGGAMDDDSRSDDDCGIPTATWIESTANYSRHAKYDAIYHLLRHGPVLFTTSDRTPRNRRVRSFLPRKCKRVKLF